MESITIVVPFNVDLTIIAANMYDHYDLKLVNNITIYPHSSITTARKIHCTQFNVVNESHTLFLLEQLTPSLAYSIFIFFKQRITES